MTRDIELYFVSVLIKEYWTQTLSNTNLLIQGNLQTVIIDLKPPQRWAAEVFLCWLAILLQGENEKNEKQRDFWLLIKIIDWTKGLEPNLGKTSLFFFFFFVAVKDQIHSASHDEKTSHLEK